MTTYKELAGLYGQRDTPPRKIHEAFGQIDLDEKGYNGSTLLHLACRHADETAVHILLERGADVQAKDNEGNTPLWQLANCPPHTYREETIRKIAENAHRQGGQSIPLGKGHHSPHPGDTEPALRHGEDNHSLRGQTRLYGQVRRKCPPCTLQSGRKHRAENKRI